MAVTDLGSLPQTMVREWLRSYEPPPPLTAMFRNPSAIAHRIGRDVTKLRSCSKAGRAWIAGARCERVGIYRDGNLRIRLPLLDPMQDVKWR